MRDQVPDFAETSLQTVKMLKFFLPAIALHIKSDLIIEVSVDYGYADERRETIAANAWARTKDSRTKVFITTVFVKAGDNEEERIFECLNSSKKFVSLLSEYTEMVIRHSKEQ